ncbi:peptidoglycan-binding protein [Kitasatospora sp. NPDC058190]|uniref:peptidoglycan-binding domain-containing protein n=1 Tax=Kitasatospora sp. NPDC058190 TaxID=3346371 RepID=UPI0036DC6017
MSLKSRITRAATATAVAGAALLTLAGPASASPSAPNIGDGYANNGAAVWCVQHNINHFLSITSDPNHPALIAEDSIWGPQTKAAVEWVQSNAYVDGQKLQVDGYVGPLTGDMIIGDGDPYYVGSYNAYCWQYIPTTYGP